LAKDNLSAFLKNFLPRAFALEKKELKKQKEQIHVLVKLIF